MWRYRSWVRDDAFSYNHLGYWMPATVETTYERAMRHPRRCFNLHHMNQCESTWVSENYVRGCKRKTDWLKPPTPWTDCQFVFKWHLNFVRCRPLGRFFRPAPLDEFNQGIMVLQKMRNLRPFPPYDMEDDCAVILDSPIWLTPFAYLHHEARLSQDWAHVDYSTTVPRPQSLRMQTCRSWMNTEARFLLRQEDPEFLVRSTAQGQQSYL